MKRLLAIAFFVVAAGIFLPVRAHAGRLLQPVPLKVRAIDVETQTTLPNSTLWVYSDTGAVLFNVSLPSGEGTIELKPGLYIFRMRSDGYRHQRRVLNPVLPDGSARTHPITFKLRQRATVDPLDSGGSIVETLATTWSFFESGGTTTKDVLALAAAYRLGAVMVRENTPLNLTALQAAGLTLLQTANPQLSPFSNVKFFQSPVRAALWTRKAISRPTISGILYANEFPKTYRGTPSDKKRMALQILAQMRAEIDSYNAAHPTEPPKILAVTYQGMLDTSYTKDRFGFATDDYTKYADVLMPWFYGRQQFPDRVADLVAAHIAQANGKPVFPLIDIGRGLTDGSNPDPQQVLASIPKLRTLTPHVSVFAILQGYYSAIKPGGLAAYCRVKRMDAAQCKAVADGRDGYLALLDALAKNFGD